MTRLTTMLALLCALALPTLSRARTVECRDTSSNKIESLHIKDIQISLRSLKARLKEGGVHILDLSPEARQHRLRLESALDERDWCLVSAHVRAIDEAFAVAGGGERFVMSKFSRVERWVREHIKRPGRRKEAERHLAAASTKIAERDLAEANDDLNRALAMLVGSRNLWTFPRSLAVLASSSQEALQQKLSVSDREVEEGCPPPPIKKRRKRSKRPASPRLPSLEDAMAKLGNAMNSRNVRTVDLKDGPAFVQVLAGYIKIGATVPATRIACGLIYRVGQIEIDLGAVMKRFHRVNQLRDDKGVTDAQRDQFSALVKRATRHIADRSFEQAHRTLDQLLILMGEPAEPAAALPR